MQVYGHRKTIKAFKAESGARSLSEALRSEGAVGVQISGNSVLFTTKTVLAPGSWPYSISGARFSLVGEDLVSEIRYSGNATTLPAVMLPVLMVSPFALIAIFSGMSPILIVAMELLIILASVFASRLEAELWLEEICYKAEIRVVQELQQQSTAGDA